MSPYRWGEWGSPGWSLYIWWRRWVATQLVTDPSTAIDPITASRILSTRLGLKLLWVNSRWNPMVRPNPVTR